MDRELLIRLVTEAQKGDSAAMEQLFAAFYDDVYYFALKTVKDSDTACDITQEAFLEIINTIGNLKEPAAFVTWTKQITYHQCTRYFKKKKDVLVEEDENGNTVFDTLADESEGSIPSEVYEKEDFRNTILAIINQLTEEQRAAVILYYFDELTVGQISQIQGVSEGTVKSRLNYARKAIKKSVEDYEEKHGIKLHSFSLMPLLLLFFDKGKMPAAKAAEIGKAVSKAARAAGSGTAAAASAGVAAKIAALPVATKIIAGAVGVAITIGIGAGGIGLLGKNTESTEVSEISAEHSPSVEDGLCPSCGEIWKEGECICGNCLYQEHVHGEGSQCGKCVLCGTMLLIVDENKNGVCDLCGTPQCG